MKILYIDNDLNAQKNMKWLCSNLDHIELKIIDSFGQLHQAIKEYQPNFIFSERTINNQSFYEFGDIWQGIPYYVVTEQLFMDEVIQYPPTDFLQKPLINSIFENVIRPKIVEDNFSLNYFNQIEDLDFRKVMINILLDDLTQASKEIPEIEHSDKKQLTHLAHNLAGKYAMIGMEATKLNCKKLERLLKNGGHDTELVRHIIEKTRITIQLIKKATQ